MESIVDLKCLTISFHFHHSDEQHLFKWDVKTQVPTQVAKLPEDFYPLDLQWLCNTRTATKAAGPGNASGNKTNDSLLICSNDGRYIMLNRSARAERIVNAHVGSINVGRWSPDGTGLLTAGEDGVIKIWSKLGMLRSTIIQNETPIRAACWSPNSMSIAYCTGPFLAIKPLAANSKLIKVRRGFQRYSLFQFKMTHFFSGRLTMAVCCAWAGQRNRKRLPVEVTIVNTKFGIVRVRWFMPVLLKTSVLHRWNSGQRDNFWPSEDSTYWSCAILRGWVNAFPQISRQIIEIIINLLAVDVQQYKVQLPNDWISLQYSLVERWDTDCSWQWHGCIGLCPHHWTREDEPKSQSKNDWTQGHRIARHCYTDSGQNWFSRSHHSMGNWLRPFGCGNDESSTRLQWEIHKHGAFHHRWTIRC